MAADRARREWLSAPRRLQAADVLTASRWPVAVALLAAPSGTVAVALVAWVWASDALDGHLARSSGAAGRLAALDPVADAAVAVGLAWYLGTVGFLPVLTSRLVVVVLLAAWWATRAIAVQMLLQALAYGSFLWWVQAEAVPGRSALALVLVGVVLLEWRRLIDELVPTFLHGWAELLGGRRPRGGEDPLDDASLRRGRSSPRGGRRRPAPRRRSR